eukprot:9707562-Alexandrium_andersonii.AAC.1
MSRRLARMRPCTADLRTRRAAMPRMALWLPPLMLVLALTVVLRVRLVELLDDARSAGRKNVWRTPVRLG